MLDGDRLKAAADEFLAAALIGDGLHLALSRLAVSAGARDATLLVSRGVKVSAIISTQEIAEPVSDFMAGRTPPSSRQLRAGRSIRDGFFTDHDDYSDDELKVDPFYQEFLRPLGFFWHANARLDGNDSESIELSFKRWIKLGPYDAVDVRTLSSVLPILRSAADLTRNALNAKADGMVSLLQHRGSPVFELDSWGRVLRVHGVTERADAPLRVQKKRLTSSDRAFQREIDSAVAAAVTEPRRPSVAALRDREGAPLYLEFFPVPGGARDVFLASAAVAVLIQPPGRPSTSFPEALILREAFGLTERESKLASLIRQGQDLDKASRAMGVQIGTARNHLKAIFEKTGTSRQGELVSLLARMHP